MQTVVIEGTFEDVRKRVNTLLLPPDECIRVTLFQADRNPEIVVTSEMIKELMDKLDEEEAYAHYSAGC